ncbi:hypothetical protein SDC9_164427 [bioreactor metagenome]|uniref:Uncharacterized protein n=1 Tax=bioreactor metagenome TaxID=1076179 RepID=A0A645FRM1_9ZZZZ
MRLAVDLVPCVILYKSSANTRQAVIAILEEEQLPYGVIRGDFSLNSGPGFLGETAGFSDELKELLAKTPANLWLGDQFQFVVSEVEWEGGFGAMVVTDQGLYLADQSSSAPAAVWSIIPFYPLADVVRSGLDSSEIELVYRQAGREAWLKIEDSEQLAKVYTYLQRVLS